jgi:hypothetical protein
MDTRAPAWRVLPEEVRVVHRGSVTGLGVLLSALALAGGVAAEDIYVGTVTVSAGAKPASAPLTLTLTIREYTSDDRVLELAQLLHKKGHAAAVAEMAKGEAGTVRLGDRSSFRASVVRSQKTDTGLIVRVVTDRPMYLAEAGRAPTLPGDAVGYLELQLGAGGEGEGRLLPTVKVGFDSEGFLEPQSLGEGEVWPVSNVKPSK